MDEEQVSIGFIKLVRSIKANGDIVYIETVDLRLMREVQELTDDYYRYYNFENPRKPNNE